MPADKTISVPELAAICCEVVVDLSFGPYSLTQNRICTTLKLCYQVRLDLSRAFTLHSPVACINFTGTLNPLY